MDVREWSPGARSSAYRGMLWAMTISSQVPTLTLVVGPEQLLAERAVDEVLSAARRADPETERRTIDCTEPGAAGTIAADHGLNSLGSGARLWARSSVCVKRAAPSLSARHGAGGRGAAVRR